MNVSQLERETRHAPEGLEPFRDPLLSLLGADEPWTVRLHVVRLVGRIEWSGEERERVTDYLFEQAAGENRFVAAWAIDSLSMLAVRHGELEGRVRDHIHAGFESTSAATRVRCRHALERLRRSKA
jgi:ribose 1,5-bisphosphokinase PhnN